MNSDKIKQLSYDELIKYCNENNLNILTKQKKIKAHKTLINKKEIINDRIIEEP